MPVEVHETATTLTLVVNRPTSAEKSVLEASFFSERGAAFRKEFQKDSFLFPLDPKGWADRFAVYLAEQTTPDDREARLTGALDEVCRRHEAEGLEWALIGSGALWARGLPVLPHDLDLMLPKAHWDRVSRAVGETWVEPFCHVTGWVVRGFGVASRGFRIDYSFEPEAWVDGQGAVDFGPEALANLESIEWRGHRLRVPPLAFHLPSNRARGRQQTVRLIEERLADPKS